MLKNKILGKIFNTLNPQFNKIKTKVSSASVVDCSIFSKKSSPYEEEIISLTGNVNPTQMRKAGENIANATTKQEFSKDEINLFKDILGEYRTLKPTKIEPRGRLDYEISENINGDKLSLSRCYENNKPYGIELTTTNNKRVYYDLENNKFISGSDKKLQQEFEKFLNGQQPSVESFNEFVECRNMRYLRDNEIYSLKPIRTSMEKGKEIQQLEQQHHDKVQKEYNKIWRSYPTEQFYRIVGASELKAILRGETIVSKNSVARYGRPCVDITPNGYYHEISYNEPKYRIEFKRKDADGGWHERLTSRIYPFKEETQHYQVPSFDYKDVELENTTYWNGSEWVPIDIT